MRRLLSSLSEAEIRLLALGAPILAFVALFLWVLEPLQLRRAAAEAAIVEDRALLTWLKQQTPQSDAAATPSGAALQGLPAARLESIADFEEVLRATPFAGDLSRLSPEGDGVVSVTYDAVDFEALSDWLLNSGAAPHVVRAKLTPSRTPGVVLAELTFDLLGGGS